MSELQAPKRTKLGNGKAAEKIRALAGEILDRYSRGEQIRDIAKALDLKLGTLGTWMAGGAPADLSEPLARAKRSKARHHAEQGLAELDISDAELTALGRAASAAVNARSKRSDYHKWLAGVLDRETYGPREMPGAADVAAAVVVMAGLARPPTLKGTAEVTGSAPAPLPAEGEGQEG